MSGLIWNSISGGEKNKAKFEISKGATNSPNYDYPILKSFCLKLITSVLIMTISIEKMMHDDYDGDEYDGWDDDVS